MDVQLTLSFSLILYSLGSALAEDIDLSATLGCHVRQYTYRIDKSTFDEFTGDILECWDNVTVDSCWGRCDSSEIPDYQMPYKLSDHTVCTYSGKRERKVTLANCDPRHPDPQAHVFDAVACVCKPCSPSDTSCQHLNG